MTLPKSAPALLVTELPLQLRGIGCYGPLLAALVEEAVLGKWPEGTAYHEAPQPEAIGRVLVRSLHLHLVNCRIGYLFRESMKRNDKIRLASASKVGARLQYFAELDFLIEVNWEGWRSLTAAQRIALIDHELCHCATEETEAGTKLVLLSHDVEEFGSIVHRWGLWKPDLMQFGKVVSRQMSLFESPAGSVLTLEERERAQALGREIAEGLNQATGEEEDDEPHREKPDPTGLKDLANIEAEKAEREPPVPPLTVQDGGVPHRRGRKKGAK